MVLPSLHEDAVLRGFPAFLSHSQVIKTRNREMCKRKIPLLYSAQGFTDV